VVIFEGVLILRILVKLFAWALILRKLQKAKLKILRFQLYLEITLVLLPINNSQATVDENKKYT
jgi:hypothetical protein